MFIIGFSHFCHLKVTSCVGIVRITLQASVHYGEGSCSSITNILKNLGDCAAQVLEDIFPVLLQVNKHSCPLIALTRHKFFNLIVISLDYLIATRLIIFLANKTGFVCCIKSLEVSVHFITSSRHLVAVSASRLINHVTIFFLNSLPGFLIFFLLVFFVLIVDIKQCKFLSLAELCARHVVGRQPVSHLRLKGLTLAQFFLFYRLVKSSLGIIVLFRAKILFFENFLKIIQINLSKPCVTIFFIFEGDFVALVIEVHLGFYLSLVAIISNCIETKLPKLVIILFLLVSAFVV